MKWHEELHKEIQDFMLLKCLSRKEILAFLTTTLVGTLALEDYSDEFVKKTFDRCYNQYLKKKKEFKSDERTIPTEHP